MKINENLFQNPALQAQKQNEPLQKAQNAEQIEQNSEQMPARQSANALGASAANVDKSKVLSALDELHEAAMGKDDVSKASAQAKLQEQLKSDFASEFNADFLRENAKGFAASMRAENISNLQFASLLA